jgi:hypothetical protein
VDGLKRGARGRAALTDTAAGVALLAIRRTGLGAVGRLVARLAAVVAETAGGLAVLGDVADCEGSAG